MAIKQFLSPVYVKLEVDGKHFLEKVKKFLFCCLFHIFCMAADLATSFINQKLFPSVKVWYVFRLIKYASKKGKKIWSQNLSTYTRIKPPGHLLNTMLDSTIFEKLLPLNILEGHFIINTFLPRNVNLSKFNKKNVRKRCEIWSK